MNPALFRRRVRKQPVVPEAKPVTAIPIEDYARILVTYQGKVYDLGFALRPHHMGLLDIRRAINTAMGWLLDRLAAEALPSERDE